MGLALFNIFKAINVCCPTWLASVFPQNPRPLVRSSFSREAKRGCVAWVGMLGGIDIYFFYWECPPAHPTFFLFYPFWPVLRIRIIILTQNMQNNGSNFLLFLISDPWNMASLDKLLFKRSTDISSDYK